VRSKVVRKPALCVPHVAQKRKQGACLGLLDFGTSADTDYCNAVDALCPIRGIWLSPAVNGVRLTHCTGEVDISSSEISVRMPAQYITVNLRRQNNVRHLDGVADEIR